MQSLRDVDWDALEWAPAAGRGWELRAGKELVARLRFIAPATLTAEAEATEGQWRLALTGMMLRKLTVHEAAAPGGPPLMAVRPNLRHIWTLPRADGSALRWQAPGLVARDWVCTDQDRRPLITLHLIAADLTGRVVLQKAARAVPGLSLAVVIGWYLLMAYHMDEGAF